MTLGPALAEIKDNPEGVPLWIHVYTLREEEPKSAMAKSCSERRRTKQRNEKEVMSREHKRREGGRGRVL